MNNKKNEENNIKPFFSSEQFQNILVFDLFGEGDG